MQAQVLNLLMDLQDELGLAYLFVCHDLGVVEHIGHRIAVMYLGQIVELAAKDELFAEPLHPYTQALIDAAPMPDPRAKRERLFIEGDVPTPDQPAVRLPLPHPLPLRLRALQRRGAGPAHDAGWGAAGGLSPHRGLNVRRAFPNASTVKGTCLHA